MRKTLRGKGCWYHDFQAVVDEHAAYGECTLCKMKCTIEFLNGYRLGLAAGIAQAPSRKIDVRGAKQLVWGETLRLCKAKDHRIARLEADLAEARKRIQDLKKEVKLAMHSIVGLAGVDLIVEKDNAPLL